ncbi:ROK family protein [Rhizosphaericola mali]|uniref:ROK family protein n=1 Tax=Rhizosphaericola mali TaxID=2545455 RepID=A0A5P2G015_9BACT|nr:ROK family protein [Rhizosphaericola mali]QES87130.1 ROK family protein [Rhizosphaericola mali]
MNNYLEDSRIILTLDAGGTNFVFSAIKNGDLIVAPMILNACSDNLDKCLNNLVIGFSNVIELLPYAPSAISFAFPGPADYPNGIISNDLPNFPAFKNLIGFPLATYLEEKFQIPVYINNDGNLYALGEAMFGFLPSINNVLRSKGINKEYNNLLGLTLGTGFGGGIVINSRLLHGENSCAAEIYSLRSYENAEWFVEETLSIRGIQRIYRKLANETRNFNPYQIFKIAQGELDGNKNAAIETYSLFGKVLGDAIANCISILDCLVVIGGGIIGASELFMPSLMGHLNGTIESSSDTSIKRIPQKIYNLNDEIEVEKFLYGNEVVLESSYYSNKINYDNHRRLGIALSKIGASEAIAKGAYAYAIQKLELIK